MKTLNLLAMLLLALAFERSALADPAPQPAGGEKRLNNLVAQLLEAGPISQPSTTLKFARPTAGWIFVSAKCQGAGSVKIWLDDAPAEDTLVARNDGENTAQEAVRPVAAGEHQLHVECAGGAQVEKLLVRAIPELIHCGLGFNSSIKSYGIYDMEFLKRDILPNVTTLIVPSNIELPKNVVDGWHRQGKKFVAEAGINSQAHTAAEHAQFWTGILAKNPALDGFIINEFIVNNPAAPPGTTLSPERQARRERELERHRVFEEAFRLLRADPRLKGKQVYAYVGGSGKKLNQEMIGPTFVHTLLDCDARIALERYVHERSSEAGSRDALREFVDGIADWEAKEPGVKQKMVIAFGLFSMPPGGINKVPGVDYHVWMDQQMHTVANDPLLDGIGGLEWWTTILADEETTRFVGRLYRHYGIEGNTTLLTRDPLFLSHLQNADFEKGTEGWTLHAAEPGSIESKSFPRYGRIEGRFMGLGRPADPEHIGDTFLWMKRSAKGPNSFSQQIKNLEPGRLYSLKMFSCDYQDLTNPAKKAEQEAQKFLGQVELDGVELDTRRSFTEIYASNPEPPIPVWITYHWKVFRATGPTATLTVSDWPKQPDAGATFGQEQTFNFLELQPYHE